MTELTTTALISTADLTEITRDVWQTFVGEPLHEVDDTGLAVAADTMTGCVQLAGGWDGTVLVELGADHARTAAEAMFAAPAGSLGEDDVCDALGELTNMIAGNVKGAVGAPARLSMPSVARGSSYTVRVVGAVRREHVLLQGAHGVLRVSVCRVC